MFTDLVDKVKFFNEKYPYQTTIIIFIIASLIGITIQYLIDGRFIKPGFYTASFIALVRLIAIWNKKKRF